MEQAGKGDGLEGDEFISYPVKLERWLMEGSYDRVWGATKREGVPSEEFGVFSEVSGILTPRDVWVQADGRLVLGLGRNDKRRNCFLLREGVPVTADRERQEPPFPR